eukprot:scaffold14551_cov112-Cylindrotheca_fusiformis.AAC.1
MLKRFRWSLATYHLVDWPLFARSRARLQASHRQLIKFGFDILPTNVVVARSNPALSELCPLCDTSGETNDHLYQCGADSVRCWRSHTLAALRELLDQWDTRYGLVELLLAGLSIAFDPDAENILRPTDFPEPLHSLIREQNLIGWRHLFRGRASRLWAVLQQEEYSMRLDNNRAITGSSWLVEVLCLLQTQVLSLWRQRNEVVFSSSSAESLPIRRDRVLRELRMIHSHRQSYRPGDVQFLMTPDASQEEDKFQHLLATKGVGSLEGWVARFTPFFKESIQKAKLLPSAVKLTPSIRSIFQPIRPRPLNIRGRPPDSPRATRRRRRRRPRLNPGSSIRKFFTVPTPHVDSS